MILMLHIDVLELVRGHLSLGAIEAPQDKLAVLINNASLENRGRGSLPTVDSPDQCLRITTMNTLIT